METGVEGVVPAVREANTAERAAFRDSAVESVASLATAAASEGRVAIVVAEAERVAAVTEAGVVREQEAARARPKRLQT